MKHSVRILGVDPGSQITGYGVIEVWAERTVLVGCGAIRTAGEHSARLKEIFIGISRAVRELCPEEVAIEQVFVHRNADSALKLGQARAAALCATFEASLPVFEYSARHIKKAVVGRGGAEKQQVQHMVKTLLGVRTAIQADAADALAAALCRAHDRAARMLLSRASGAA